jgi:hypothetical protein
MLFFLKNPRLDMDRLCSDSVGLMSFVVDGGGSCGVVLAENPDD